jgi:hypothetical protein
MSETRNYSNGTSLIVQMPWSVFVGGHVMCSDGKVRKISRISQTADTFFSIPASVKVKGKTVAGYVTFSDDETATFVAYTYRKNGHLLP